MKKHFIKRKKKKRCCTCYVSLAGEFGVVLWTTDAPYAGTNGDVTIRLDGERCQGGWHKLDHAWPYDDFEKGCEDGFSFFDNDVGSEVK